jgi:DNA-directed RNA polymerase alpha subunit
MNEQAPTRIYEKDKPTFERLRAMTMTQLLEQPVTVLPLAVRALAYCEKRNLFTIGQLAMAKKSEMMKAANMGRKTVAHVSAYLSEIGLGLDGKLSASVPAPIPPAWVRGAKAMRLAIMAELILHHVAHEIVTAVGRMPIPSPEDA